MIFSANMAELYTSDVIEYKAALGLDGGINFIGDHHFKDFSIIDFEIVGDKATRDLRSLVRTRQV